VVITFLSDFGLQDDFVGTCHGVIKRIAPEAEIIDITHGIPPQHVLQGALVLCNTTACSFRPPTRSAASTPPTSSPIPTTHSTPSRAPSTAGTSSRRQPPTFRVASRSRSWARR
jgi:SAM hydroxide adenosyltransferase N-terminal domain